MSNESDFSTLPEHCPDGGVSTPPPTDLSTVCRGACEVGPISHDERQETARRLRLEAANCPHTDPRCITTTTEPVCAHPCNGDEAFYFQSPTLPDGTPNPFQDTPSQKGQYPASFTKGLRHDPLTGLGDPDVYCRLLKALATTNPQDFEDVRPLGCENRPHPSPLPPPPPPGPQPDVPPTQRRLENPQSGLAFELEGADPAALFMPPAPCFASAQEAAEAAELYWMALARDVPFIQYATDPLIAAAVTDLNSLLGSNQSNLSPHLQALPFTPQNLFRGPTAGDLAGPYLSQFLLLDVPFGSQMIPAVIRTLLPQIDFLTNWDAWLEVQDGCDASQTNCDPVMRLIRSGRDSAQYVHVDRDFNAFFNACELLLFGREPTRRCEARPGLGVPFGPCLPYVNPLAPAVEEFPRSSDPTEGKSENQIGLGTFGELHLKSVLVGAAFRAFHAVWYQKWFVHRRLRPEEFGGRVHLENLRRRGIPGGIPFPINQLLFNSTTLFGTPPASDPGLVFSHNAQQNANRRTPPTDRLGLPSFDGTYLLPQVFAEGSPLHPAYGSGHSTVSGCLATILKAFFHNDWQFPSPVEPNEDGTSLRPFTGPDPLTVAGELDKLASNIGVARLWAGVHWRSDHDESLLLGEQVAISILCNQRNLFNEPFEFRFRSFPFGPYHGKVVRIRPAVNQWNDPDDDCEPCVLDLLDHYDPILTQTAGCGRRRRPYAPA